MHNKNNTNKSTNRQKRVLATSLMLSLLFSGYSGTPSARSQGGDALPKIAEKDRMKEADTAFARKDFATAYREYLPLAEQGIKEAQCNLGLMYANGQGVTQDDKQAVVWYQKAAEQGIKEAQYNLGDMYANGQGVTQDDKQAVVWYQKAAEQGLKEAQYNLGVMYANGQGVTQDYKQAFVWFQKAAEQGLKEAQFRLGVMYDNGQGVTQDYKQAFVWCQKAAEQGDMTAQFNLGVMYANGQGVTQDDKQAVVWYQKAAEQGDKKAQYNLGLMYAKGQGVTQDYKKVAATNINDATRLLGAKQSNDIIFWPPINATGEYFILGGIVDGVDNVNEAQILTVKFANQYYFSVQISSNTKKLGNEPISLRRQIWAVGKYTRNLDYTTVGGQKLFMPLIDAEYVQ